MERLPWQVGAWMLALLGMTWAFGVLSSLYAATLSGPALSTLAPLLACAPYLFAWSLMSLPTLSRAMLAFGLVMIFIALGMVLAVFIQLVTAPSLMHDTRALGAPGLAGIMIIAGIFLGGALSAGHTLAWRPARSRAWAGLHLGFCAAGALAFAVASLAVPSQFPFRGAPPATGAGIALPLGSLIAIASYVGHGLGSAILLRRQGALVLRWLAPAIAVALALAAILLRP